MPIQESFRRFQCLLESGGRVTGQDGRVRITEIFVGLSLLRPRRRIPAHRDVRKIRLAEFRGISFPRAPVVIECLGVGRFGKPIESRMMTPRVTRQAVDAELTQTRRRIGHHGFRGQVGNLPHHHVEMKIGKTGPAGDLAELVDGRARRLHIAEAAQKRPHLIDGKIGTAIDCPIARLRKISFRDVMAKSLELARVHPSLKNQRCLLTIAARKKIEPIVIGPHQRERNPLAVRRAEITLLQRPGQKGPPPRTNTNRRETRRCHGLPPP